MKLTWFGDRTLRVNIGGAVLVIGSTARPGIDADELVSGANRLLDYDAAFPAVDPKIWQPRRAVALLNATASDEVLVSRLGADTLLIDAVGEPPLILLGGEAFAGGRWTRDAVVVAFSADAATDAFDRLEPRMVAVAMPDTLVDKTFTRLEQHRNGAGLVALEPGMALEV